MPALKSTPVQPAITKKGLQSAKTLGWLEYSFSLAYFYTDCAMCSTFAKSTLFSRWTCLCKSS